MSADHKSPRLPGYLEYQGKHKGLLAWILSTDHKRIGLLYFYCMSTLALAGVVLGLLMKLELIAPGQTIMTAQSYNGLFTLHGLTMIFLFVIPVLSRCMAILCFPS